MRTWMGAQTSPIGNEIFSVMSAPGKDQLGVDTERRAPQPLLQ